MKTRFFLPLLLMLALSSRAESTKSYQVTGPIVALTDSVITIQKGDENWEIARSAATKTGGNLAVGTRVTVRYKMSADSIEVKDAAAKSAEKADRAAEKAAEKAEKKAR